MVRLVSILIIISSIGACLCEDKLLWNKNTSKERLRNSKDREETTPRSGENDDISDDYNRPQGRFFGGLGGPGGIFGGIGGARPSYPSLDINPWKGHPSNGILVGPGGPTGIIGRPRPSFFNNRFGFGNNLFGLQGLDLGNLGQGFGFGGGLPIQQSGFGGFGGRFPSEGFPQQQQGGNGFGNYGLITPNQEGQSLGNPYGYSLFDEAKRNKKIKEINE